MDSESLNILAFYGLAGLTVISALMILFSKNIVHAVFMLVVVFLGIAGIYMIANAEFVGVTQIMVYIGGILILLMFGVMLTNRMVGGEMVTGNRRVITAVLLGIGLLAAFLIPIQEKFPWFQQQGVATGEYTVTQIIGIKLMTDQLVVMELIGVLLLMSLIGASLLAGSKFENKR